MSGDALPPVAISLWLPWAWAIMYAGKDIENRSNGKRRFPTTHRGRCWVHASLWPGTRKPLGRSEQVEEPGPALLVEALRGAQSK